MYLLENCQSKFSSFVEDFRVNCGIFHFRYRNIEHSCLACVAMVNGVDSDFHTYKIEEESICKIGHTAAKAILDNWLENYKPEDLDSGGNSSE